jgi:N6-adenosine-specific RNA methylase IME4
MTLEEIAGLTVADYAEVDDCHLYLWVTNRMLPKAYELIPKWGFRYITTLTWCKPQERGVGRYYRNTTEHVIFAVKGTRVLAKGDAGTWFTADRGRHSEKPSEFFRMVEECSPGPRLEMFARGTRDSWTVWGAEADD